MITIYPGDIPEEGLPLIGSLAEDIFQLDVKDVAQPAGPTNYDLKLYRSDDLLLAEGQIEAPFTLHCVICLEPFRFTCRIENYLAEIDLENAKSIDLTERLREDLLLALPAYPHCDKGDDPDHVCPNAGKFEAATPETETVEEPSAWDALDGLGSPQESGD